MNIYNLLRGAILTLILVCFLVVPQKTFALDFNFFNFTGEEDYQVLSEFESKRILEDFPSILNSKWLLLMVDGYSDPMEKTIISLLKHVSTLNMWNYFFRDLPLDVSFNIAKQSLEIAKFVGTEDTSGILGKIEKETAKAAVNYLKEYFFKNQIKASFGAMEVKYKTEIVTVDSPFQYIIMYKPIDENRGKVVARIYSPREIIPPASRASVGAAVGFLNSLDSGQNISPFIVEISGEMKKGMYGSYFWEGYPIIKTVFPEIVPDFGLKPRTWQEKYIINPIKEAINNLGQIFDIFSGGKTAEFVDYVLKDSKDQEKIDAEVENIKSGKTIEEQYPPKEEKKETVVPQKKEPEKIVEKTTEKEKILPAAICSKNNLSGIRHNIIFNEIAWMGSKNSANDEWIELKNISGKDIDLKGYTISDKGEKIKIAFESQIIPNSGFLLLERTDDDTVPFKQADLIYQGALSNEDEELYLFDSSCNIEDYVSANPDWPSGDNTEKRTMERMNDLSWLNYSGNGLNNIWGTPKEANSPGKKKEEKKETVSNQSSASSSVISGGSPTPVNTVSYCPQSNLSSPTHQVIINEVAWMGTETNSSNEWIELKNISGEIVNLNNWQLIDKDNQIKIVFSSSDAISANGFYLLERTDNGSAPNVSGDKIYSGALSDSNESLRLFNPDCRLVDEVLAIPDWPAGDKDDQKTMERSDSLSWHTYSSLSVDSVSGLWGTPKAENSLEVLDSQEDQPEDQTVSYCLQSNLSSPTHQVVINEIAWMGTETSSSNEWIELKNISGEIVNLNNWQLIDKDNQIKIVFSSSDIIASGGFLLLERTNNDSVPNILSPDRNIFSGDINDSDESLRLFNSDCALIDEVVANPDWPAGNKEAQKTMERSDSLSWHTYSFTSADTISGLWGTPKTENSLEVLDSQEDPPEDQTVSYCLQSNLLPPTHQVIINEVAWMGTEASYDDEWIELKNVSNEIISLADWQLLDAENIKIVFDSSAIINPQGFYLLERTNDDSVPNIQMDKEYMGALSNDNESLRLFDSNCQLMDEALANPDWPAGDNESKKTMERNSDLSSWHTYSSASADLVSGLWGTPKAENSLAVDEVPVVLITEVQINGTDGHEYIELFNQSEREISLCSSEEHCYYLSYYPFASGWANPIRNWKFLPGAVILPNSYYIIDVFGDSGGDWWLKTIEETDYVPNQLDNSYGSLALFSGNPKYSGGAEKPEDEANAVSLKIDAIGWSNGTSFMVVPIVPVVPIVKEGQAFALPIGGTVIGRKWTDGEYTDSDDNSKDFQAEMPSPRSHTTKPPSPVNDLSFASSPEQKNSVILSWTIPEDEDTSAEDIGYEIYYSRNGQIDENNLLNIEEYVDVEIASGENNIKTAIISDLYYSSGYAFAIKAKDPEKNYSLLSNNVSFPIGEAIHQKPAPYYDSKRSNRSNFAGPINENLGEAVVFAQGSDGGTSNDYFDSSVMIDENGTAYFRAEIDGVWGVYAYTFEGKKWGYECSIACYACSVVVCNEPSLGKDGLIYFSSDKSVYALSPSGKLEWKIDFEKVYTKNIVIDSQGRIYFIASEGSNNAILFAFDGKEKISIWPLGDLTSGVFSELVIDNSDNIFLSMGDSVFKFKLGMGKIAEKSFPVEYSVNYLGERNRVSRAEQVNISFDGRVLVNIYQGWCESYQGSIIAQDVFYALDNNLENVIWKKREYGSVSSVGVNEFYFTALRIGGMVNFWDISAIDLSDGHIEWTKRWRFEGTFSPPSSVVSDSGSNIYLTQSTNIFGYDSLNITDEIIANDTIISFYGAQQYCFTPLSIGNGVMYIPKVDKIMAVRY